MDEDLRQAFNWTTFLSAILMIFVAFGMWGCPKYAIYSARLSGEAELANAEYSKQVSVQTAQAKKDSAQLLAEAAIIQAGGVAKANQIIGDSLKGNEAYLRYLWIDKLDTDHAQVIYVPTETNMPIMEAGRGPKINQ